MMKWNETNIYVFVQIDHNGNIYEGRGWGVSGAHAPGYNSKGVGISFIGNYQSTYLIIIYIIWKTNIITILIVNSQ